MERFVIFLLVIEIALWVSVVSADLEDKYDHAAFLDPTEKYKLYWSVKDADKSIHFAVQVDTTGWVGFGVSAGLSGNMKGADIVMGWVDSQGKGHVEDYHGVGNRFPVKDGKQDFDFVGGSETNGKTVLEFKRKLNTCDKEDKEIPLGTTKVIFAYGLTDTPQYHMSRRGSRSLNLLNYVKNSPPPAAAKYFDIVSANVSVPKKKTTYWCEAFKMEDLVSIKSKKHIIEIAPVIEQIAFGIVHHMDLYSCHFDFDEKHLSTKGPCYHPNMPSSIRECSGNSVVFAWSIGGNNFKFPAHVGMPLDTSNNMKYVVLQIHFDNPLESDKFVVSAGLRLYYDTPRQYDAELLTTGFKTGESMIIPPKQSLWTSVAQCSKECSAKIAGSGALNGNEIRFFAASPHAHLAATGMWTKHIRNGKELTEVIRDDNYDFNFQQTHLFRKELTFRAGDELLTYCRYNTMKRSEATIGGESTTDEMCFNFIMYYPRINFTQCAAYDSSAYNFAKKYAKKSKNLVYSNWTDVAWNASMVASLKAHYASKKQAVMPVCLGLSGFRYSMNLGDRSTIKEKLPPKNDVCAVSSGVASKPQTECLLQALKVLLLSLFLQLFLQ